MTAQVQTGTITTTIPARLDRLPWSSFHKRVLLGLGTVWILDGLEVTMVGTVASRLTQPGSGISITTGDIGVAGALYIVGACLGALVFGHLTDRLGRKKLFLLTLGIYIAATVATAFSWSAWWFFLARFATGSGIGGEYAAINSAIDELIPARVRGRVDLVINGTYWLGSAAGSALAILFLDEAILPAGIGWRLAFLVGVVLGVTILLVRRHVPESPRWLFIHGRDKQAERIVRDVERDVERDTGRQLEDVQDSITVRQRRAIPFSVIARTAITRYPRRTLLGLALFVGQAFIYNGVTFNLGSLFSTYYGVSSGFVPVFVIIYAVGNFLGPVTLGRLFDTIGRKPMICGTYLGSTVVTVPMALLFWFHGVGPWGFIILVVITFFLASAGASAAYLTVSEIFPMETRALAIAFFYAVGTAIGGIAGPLLFSQLIASNQRSQVALAFFIGAGVMALGGVAELFWGVKAEGAALEDIAQPLTYQDARSSDQTRTSGTAGHRGSRAEEARSLRERALDARAQAAEHRALAVETTGLPDDDGNGTRQFTEQAVAEQCDLRAAELDERATALTWLEEAAGDADRAPVLTLRAAAADHRADALAERGAACVAPEREARTRTLLAHAAEERARACVQRAEAEAARRESPGPDDAADADNAPNVTRTDAAVSAARATMHQAWADMHEATAAAHQAHAGGDLAAQERHEQQAATAQARALAAEQRLVAAQHRAEASRLRAEPESDSRGTTEGRTDGVARARPRTTRCGPARRS